MRKLISITLITLSASFCYAGYNPEGGGAAYDGTGVSPIVTSTVAATNADGLWLIDDGGNGLFIADGGNIEIGGELDVTGTTDINGNLNLSGNTRIYSWINLRDDIEMRIGSGNDCVLIYETADNPDTLVLGLGTDSKGMIIADRADYNYDFAHPLQSHPTLFIHSSNQSATEWGSLANDTDYFVIDAGNDGVKIATDTIVEGGITCSTITLSQIKSAGGGTFFLDWVQMNEGFRPYSRTEAELKALVPNGVGEMFYDSTNKAVVLSTGTLAGQFGQINDGSQTPVGW